MKGLRKYKGLIKIDFYKRYIKHNIKVPMKNQKDLLLVNSLKKCKWGRSNAKILKLNR